MGFLQDEEDISVSRRMEEGRRERAEGRSDLANPADAGEHRDQADLYGLGSRRYRASGIAAGRMALPSWSAGAYVRRPALDNPAVCRIFDRRSLECVLPLCTGRGTKRAVGCIRSRDPSRL